MDTSDTSGNAERLRSEGLIDDSEGPLPDEYYAVIDQLTAEEIDALVSLRGRLVDAEIPTAPLTQSLLTGFLHLPGPVIL